jgi:hypothetical protein
MSDVCTRVENPRVGDSIPPQATRSRRLGSFVLPRLFSVCSEAEPSVSRLALGPCERCMGARVRRPSAQQTITDV